METKAIALKKLIISMNLLLFVFIVDVDSNSLRVSSTGDVAVDTDRYFAFIEKGRITQFYNKLTQEIYTQGEIEAQSLLKTTGRILESIDIAPEIERISLFECGLIYRVDDKILRLFIGIDAETGDLLIRQSGSSRESGIEHIMWGFSNLTKATVDVISPVRGGRTILEPGRYHYSDKWETPLVILQGQRGGCFIRSDDTQYQFKFFEYGSEGDSFYINFAQLSQAPIDRQRSITAATWRLNAYQGDWQVPALVYRKWMHEALKPVDLTQIPAWVNNIELVITHADPLERVGTSVIDTLYQLVDPEKTLLYVTGWRKAGWSLYYPDQTPTDNFEEFLTQAHRYGFKVMLHTNIVAVALDHPLYSEFEKYQMINRSGVKVGARLNDTTEPLSRKYIWVNPASHSYRNILVNQLKRVHETYDVDAIHLDINSVIYNNPLVDGLTMPEGNILLHQELRDAMPGVVFGGERINDATFRYVSFAQRYRRLIEQPHPISNFLFSPYVRFYGHLGFPNPDIDPDNYQIPLHQYEVWGVIPTVRLDGASDLDPELIETHKLLELARERQNWTFGDVNNDGIVNILDLTNVAQHFGTLNPKVDVNKDGVVNIIDLTLVAQQLN